MPIFSQSQKLHAVVVSSKNYGEADKIVTLFSKERGKVIALAKGVRKLTSKKRSSLLVFSHIQCEFVETKGMGIIREARLINSFDHVRTDLKRVSVGYFLCEVVKKMTVENVSQENVFDLFTESLFHLNEGGHTKYIKNEFTKNILELSGFAIHEGEDPNIALAAVLERELGSVRVGRMIQ